MCVFPRLNDAVGQVCALSVYCGSIIPLNMTKIKKTNSTVMTKNHINTLDDLDEMLEVYGK